MISNDLQDYPFFVNIKYKSLRFLYLCFSLQDLWFTFGLSLLDLLVVGFKSDLHDVFTFWTDE